MLLSLLSAAIFRLFFHFDFPRQAWDLAVDISLSQLPDLIKGGDYQHSPFFAEQLTAFQVWLTIGCEGRQPPEQLPIVLQVKNKGFLILICFNYLFIILYFYIISLLNYDIGTTGKLCLYYTYIFQKVKVLMLKSGNL